MNGSIKNIVTLGFGNGTFAGTPGLVVTMGYGVGAAAVSVTPTLFAMMPVNKGHVTLPENKGHLTIPNQ